MSHCKCIIVPGLKHYMNDQRRATNKIYVHVPYRAKLLSDFIDLTQVHNFTVSAQDIFTFRRLSVFTVSFTGILQLLMQIMKRFVPSY